MSTRIDGDSIHIQHPFRKFTVSTISTAGNVTYTAAQLIGGIVQRDCNGTGRTDTTPTAAQIVSEMKSINSAVEDYSSFTFFLNNNSGASPERITLSAGTGVTLYGENRINIDKSSQFLVLITDDTASSEAVSFFNITESYVV